MSSGEHLVFDCAAACDARDRAEFLHADRRRSLRDQARQATGVDELRAVLLELLDTAG